MLSTKRIGERITEARKKFGISQAQLAERLFISAQAVGKWERGESMPDIITFNRLAEILGVDLNYFSKDLQHTVPEEANEEVSSGTQPESGNGQGKRRSWDMSRENLVDTDFSGLKNLHEKFASSNMQRCLFVGSDLSGLLLKSNNVESCDFSGSDISRSKIQSSNLSNNTFNGCSLIETEFLRSYVEGCDFSDSDFTGVELKSGGFGNNTVTGAVWNRTSFRSMHIADVVFEGTIEECLFENCGFSGVIFRNATLINTFFKHNKKMKKIRFVDCKADKLTYAFLKKEHADLSGITVIEA